MASTIVQLFLAQARRLAHRVALRSRGAYGWEETTWRQYARHVDAVGWGLLAGGVRPGDRVGIMAPNCPAWLYADLGAMGIGAVTVPIYPTLIAAQASHVIAHSAMTTLFVAGASQRDKIRAVRSQAPALRQVVCIDCDGHGGGEGGEQSWDDFLAAGRVWEAGNRGALEGARAQVRADRLATIVYTSGTTGPPKGAMLSHRNLVFEAGELQRHVDLPEGIEMLSFLPLSHVAERLQGELVAIKAGGVVNFARSLDTLKEDLLEIRPSLLTCVPRLWEKLHEGIMIQVGRASPRRRQLFDWALSCNRERFRRTCAGERVGRRLWLQAEIGDQLVGARIRKRLGLDRARLLISGAAPLSPDIQRFFGALRLPIQEAYGQTECTGVSHATPHPDAVRPGYVGPKLAGIDVRIAEDGEILVRGDNVFAGYFDDAEATAAALVDGWLHTGDVGQMSPEGYLRLTERKKDIIITAGGKNVAPQNIETRLAAYNGVSQAVVLGDKRKYLVALITIDRDAAEQVLGTAVGSEPSKDAALRRYLQACVDTVNERVSSFETVKRFEILDEDFSVAGGELTPTFKVKRRVIDERYRHLIDNMYRAA